MSRTPAVDGFVDVDSGRRKYSEQKQHEDRVAAVDLIGVTVSSTDLGVRHISDQRKELIHQSQLSTILTEQFLSVVCREISICPLIFHSELPLYIGSFNHVVRLPSSAERPWFTVEAVSAV